MVRLRFSFLLVLFALAPAGAQNQQAREFKECSVCSVMVGIPAGQFLMGSPATEQGRFEAEGPLHPVLIRAFALGKYDVTVEEFLTFLRDSGYQPRPCNPMLNDTWRNTGRGLAYPPQDVQPPRWPASCLDWKDAQAYIAWLNKKLRLERPNLRGPGPYRLPSEAEWEYAARGGTTTARWWGEEIGTDNANCNGCGSKFDDSVLSDVDAFAANPFGLYGMLGNVWQWTQDCWHDSYVGAPKDGSAWMSGTCPKHVIRGGSWGNVPLFVRAATRSDAGPDGGEYDYSSLSGFRLARTLP
jgi:formylglycine-generating enzyme required for sulfatase activity